MTLSALDVSHFRLFQNGDDSLIVTHIEISIFSREGCQGVGVFNIGQDSDIFVERTNFSSLTLDVLKKSRVQLVC